MNPAQPLIAALRRMGATGPTGFEGLVARLLGALTGRVFRLASSGRQHGRDLTARSRDELTIFVECKRFGKLRQFNDIALAGSMTVAQRSDHRLDLWVLAASKPVPDQTDSTLMGTADQLALDVAVLDCGEDDPGPLAVLCAHLPDITLDMIPKGQALSPCLARIRAQPSFTPTLETIRTGFSELRGYADLRAAACHDLLRSLADVPSSRSRFGQLLLPLSPAASDVPRPAPVESLRAWWRGWSSRREPLLVHGEEGTGKSWTLGSWLGREILPTEGPPLVIWCSSPRFDFSPLLQLGAALLARDRSSEAEVSQLKQRLKRWASVVEATPRVLFVIDGLNERPDANRWRLWLDDAQRDLQGLLPGAALALTCRTAYWRSLATVYQDELVPPEVRIGTSPAASPTVCEVLTLDYDDPELEAAFAAAGVDGSGIDPTVLRRVRRPRNFSLAVRHWAECAHFEDFTIERLIFEDWRHRWEARLRKPLDKDEFAALLTKVARDWQELGRPDPGHWQELGRTELAQMLTGRTDESLAGVEELVTSGVFVSVAGSLRKFRLEPDRLYLGLGFLLVEQLAALADRGLDAMLEETETAVEAQGDADQTATIVAYAVSIALTGSGSHAHPPDLALALLLVLACRRNGADAWQRAKPWSFFRRNPDAFRRLAEVEWAKENPNFEARQRIGFAFAWIAEKWPGHEELVRICRRWLSLICRDGFRFMGGGLRDGREARRLAIAERLREAGELAQQSGGDTELVESPALLDIAYLALLIASNGPQSAYLSCLVAWSISRAVLGVALEIEEVRWILRFAPDDARRSLVASARQLQSLGNPLAQQAAEILFDADASPELREEAALPPGTEVLGAEDQRREPKRKRQRGQARRAQGFIGAGLRRAALDPARQPEDRAWRPRNLLRSLTIADLVSGRQRTESDLLMEEAEAALCRTAATSFARLLLKVARRVLESCPDDSEARDWLLDEGFLLLSRKDLVHARTLANQLDASNPGGPDQKPWRDWNIAGIVVAGLLGARAQLRFLLDRRGELDDADWLHVLAPFGPKEVRGMLRSLRTSTGSSRRRFLSFSWEEVPQLSPRDREILREVSTDHAVGARLAGLPALRARDPQLLLWAVEDRVFDQSALGRIAAWHRWARATFAEAQRTGSLNLGLAAESWVLMQDGLPSDGVRAWAQAVDQAIRQARAGPNPVTAGGPLAPPTIAEAMRVATEVTDCWIADPVSEKGPWHRVIDLYFNLVTGLAVGLLNSNDPRAITVFEKLSTPGVAMVKVVDGQSDVPILSFLPFEAEETRVGQELIRQRLSQALTDEELQHLAFAAAFHCRSTTLVAIAQATLQRGHQASIARALTVTALAPWSEDNARLLQELTREAVSWVTAVASWAHAQHQSDAWAREWFRRFLHSPKRVEAWAAFRLFLQCVDRRWVLWSEAELRDARGERDFTMRKRHLELNRNLIERRVKEAAGRREKTLFGLPIPSADLLPWKQAWKL